MVPVHIYQFTIVNWYKMSKTAKQEGDSTASSCGVKVSTAGDPVPSAAFRCSACDAVADYSASGAVFLRLLATGLCHAGVPAAVAVLHSGYT